MPIKAVVMDFGNTLVDYPLIDWNSQIEFIKGFLSKYSERLPTNCEHSADELAVQLNTEKADGSVWHFIERVRSSSFFGAAFKFKAAREFEIAICEAVFDQATLFQDSIEFVMGLRSSGYLTGIVSNLPWGTSSAIWRSEFHRHGFSSGLIDHIVCCVDVGYRKPNPAPLLECIARLDCTPSEVIFVGDAIVSDVQAALAAGCLPVLLDRRGAYETYQGIRVRSMSELRLKLDELRFPAAIDRIDGDKARLRTKHPQAMVAGARK